MTITAIEIGTSVGYSLGVSRDDAFVLVTHIDPATLQMPEDLDPDWGDRVACAGRSAEFDVDDADLDAQLRALVICSTCPVLNECRAYALRNDISGVAGGLTRDARSAWQRLNRIRVVDTSEYVGEEVASLDAISDIDYARAGHGSARQRAETVMLLANRGHSATQIAEVLGCSVRSVNRLVGIAVHHYGIELGADAVISVSAQPPKSIEHRGELPGADATQELGFGEDYDDEFDHGFLADLAGDLVASAAS